MSSISDLVFVYGTLRHGGSNHLFLAGQECLGRHLTAARYTMLDIGAYPGVIAAGDTAITGEVYRVTAATFRDLDLLEDYPIYYDRSLIVTPWGQAWIYLYIQDNHHLPTIHSGDWLQR